MNEYLKEFFEYRAAIYEYEANFTREKAEMLAFADTRNKEKELKGKQNENDRNKTRK